jgi:hypothetical protein
MTERTTRRSHRPARLVWTALFLAACALAAAHPIAAQQRVTATSGDPDAIARVRALFAEIEREAPTYRRTTHDVWEFSLEGGSLEGFYRGRELRKLRAELFGETWRGTEEYYFSGGRPVFIFVVHERYDEPMSGRVRHRIEHRYYFDGGRLIRRVRTQHPRAGEDLSTFDPDLQHLLRNARLFAACAAATGAEPPECTAPEHDPGES